MKTKILGVVIALSLLPVTAGGEVSAQERMVRGNHYVCHPARMKMKPVKLSLRDQFGGYISHVYDLVYLCNPAIKKGKGHDARMVQPRLHLACYRLRVVSQPELWWGVRIWNQFFPKGRDLKVQTRPQMLCVPTSKKRLK